MTEVLDCIVNGKLHYLIFGFGSSQRGHSPMGASAVEARLEAWGGLRCGVCPADSATGGRHEMCGEEGRLRPVDLLWRVHAAK